MLLLRESLPIIAEQLKAQQDKNIPCIALEASAVKSQRIHEQGYKMYFN